RPPDARRARSRVLRPRGGSRGNRAHRSLEARLTMATVRLRLFAAARDAAGAGNEVVDAVTLGDALDAARERHGARFVQVLDGSRVWVNGDEPAAGDATVLADGDEIAVVPPVSGGCR